MQNIEDSNAIKAGSHLDKSKLQSLGLIKKENKPLKLLGKGTLSKKIKIEVDSASTNAVEAVKKAGGEVIKIA